MLWFVPLIAKKKTAGRRYVPKSLSISPEMEEEITQRMRALGIENFSRYIQDLVRDDLEEKKGKSNPSVPSKTDGKTKTTTKKK